MKEMAKLLQAGKIRSVGVSNFSAKQMQAAHDALAAEGIVLASNQVRFNLLDRSIEKNGVLETGEEARRHHHRLVAAGAGRSSRAASTRIPGRWEKSPACVG